MSTRSRQHALQQFEQILGGCARAIHVPFRHQFERLMKHMVASLERAVNDGVPLLESAGSRWAAFATVPDGWGNDAFVAHVLEDEVILREDAKVRRLLAVYGVLLGDFDTVSRNLEPVAVSNLDELTWLVAGALWVQWGSGQPTTHQLRESLLRIRARNPYLDAHIQSVLSREDDGARDAAIIIHDLLTNPSASLPEPRAAP